MKRQYRIYEDAFLRKYKDKSPKEIIETEGKKALATISRIRELAVKEENSLKAAMFIVEKAFPSTQKIHLEGSLDLEKRLDEALSRLSKREGDPGEFSDRVGSASGGEDL